MIEFIIIFWFAFSLLLLVIQIVLMFNAHSIVKLAAFNAARAAIVTREDEPADPVKFDQMKDQARLAAFLTVLPVIPGFHARIGSLADVPTLVTSLPADLASVGFGALKGHGQGVVALAVEFLGFSARPPFPRLFDVKFQKVKNPGAANETWEPLTSVASKIEFDDPSKVRENLIRVIVEWEYPLVIPLADQIIYALVRPLDWQAALIQKGELVRATIGFGAETSRPVWEIGWALRDTIGPWNLTGFRIPIRGSYIMRMQWDRGPN